MLASVRKNEMPKRQHSQEGCPFFDYVSLICTHCRCGYLYIECCVWLETGNEISLQKKIEN